MTQSPRQPQSPPRRLLAVDPGERRTGVAISDELGLYAHTRPAIVTRSAAEAVEAIARLAEAEGVGELIVGLPISLSGADSAQTASVRETVAKLRARLTIPVTEWDERLSSVEAARTVTGASRRRSGELDSAAAAVVLQAVLDSRRGGVRQ
jgi:putative Holliday junction resolvase